MSKKSTNSYKKSAKALAKSKSKSAKKTSQKLTTSVLQFNGTRVSKVGRALMPLFLCASLDEKTKTQLRDVASNAIEKLKAGDFSKEVMRELSYFSTIGWILSATHIRTDENVVSLQHFADLKDSMADAMMAPPAITRSFQEDPSYLPDENTIDVLQVAFGIYSSLLDLITSKQLYAAEDHWAAISTKKNVVGGTELQQVVNG